MIGYDHQSNSRQEPDQDRHSQEVSIEIPLLDLNSGSDAFHVLLNEAIEVEPF